MARALESSSSASNASPMLRIIGTSKKLFGGLPNCTTATWSSPTSTFTSPNCIDFSPRPDHPVPHLHTKENDGADRRTSSAAARREPASPASIGGDTVPVPRKGLEDVGGRVVDRRAVAEGAHPQQHAARHQDPRDLGREQEHVDQRH